MAIVSKNYDITADICVALEHSGADITKLAGKVVLVTGGTGFFGRWFLALLVEVRRKLGGDLEIISVSRNPKKFLDRNPELALEGVEYLSGDIVSFKIPNHERVTHLVHLLLPLHKRRLLVLNLPKSYICFMRAHETFWHSVRKS